MKLCKDILKDTSSLKIAFNTLYENYIALVKKKRLVLCWYYQNICNIITPDTAALHRTVTSGGRLTCNHYTIYTNDMQCGGSSSATEVTGKPFQSFERMNLKPVIGSFPSSYKLSLICCCFNTLRLTSKYPPQQLLASSVNVWIPKQLIVIAKKGYRMWLHVNLKKFYS